LCDSAEHARLIRALGARSAIVAPLIAHGIAFGTISLARAQEERPFGDADLESVQEIADRAANAIEHAQLYHRAQAAVRLRDEFFCLASHELNTPIAALMLSLKGLSTVLGSVPIKVNALSKSIEIATRQGQRLARLVHNMLNVTRIDRGLELQCEEVD